MSERGRFRGARERAGMVSPPSVDPDQHIGEHLIGPLFGWCLSGDINMAGPMFDEPRLSERGTRMCVALGIAASTVDQLGRIVGSQPDVLIDMIDWLVREHLSPTRDPYQFHPPGMRDVRAWLDHLDNLLESGGSAWTVDLELPGLAQRVSAAERNDLHQATSVEDAATEYLREAWAAAWGISPEGESAYDKAIKALEAMFRPVVAPKNAGASLGEIARDLRANPGKWSVRMDDGRPATDSRRAAGCRCVPDRECGWHYLRCQSPARRGRDSCC